MRFLSIHLPFLPTDRIFRREKRSGSDASREPLALWAKIDNAQVVTAVDAVAVRRNLHPGMPVAVARGMCPKLRLLEADARADGMLLAATADWCRRFTPLAALDGSDGIILDVSGVAHLHGGVEGLLRNVEDTFMAQNFACRLALAPHAAAASAFARWDGPRLVGDDAALEKAVRKLPATALDLDLKAAGRLRDAGLRTIGDLLLRPRAPITARFGSHVFARIDAMLGHRRDPMSPRFEAPPYMAERRFPEGLARHEEIAVVVAALCEELCAMLARHDEGARKILASFFRVDGVVRDVETATGRPVREPRLLARLLNERLDAIGEDGLDTGYGFDVIRLAALAVEPLAAQQAGLPADRGEKSRAENFSDLVDRLGARLGTRRVMRFDFVDTHWPERAVTLRPAAWGPADVGKRDADGAHLPSGEVDREAIGWGVERLSLSNPPQPSPEGKEAIVARQEAGFIADDGRKAPLLPSRPAKLFEKPEPIEAVAFTVPDGPPMRFRWRRVMHELVAFEGPERIASEWWRDVGPTRDYFRVEDSAGGRFWLFREGLFTIETTAPRWFMHGVFG